MHTDPEAEKPDVNPTGEPQEGAGYETTDVTVSGVIVFLVALSIFVAVFFVFCFGMGKVINRAMEKHDGKPDQWNQEASSPTGKREDMANNPKLEQEELAKLTARFSTPRLEVDDGNQDLTELHIRESLLLDHYSWIDRGQGTVRIPISRAMEILASQGLPLAPAEEPAPSLVGEPRPKVIAPLTNGFARTGYEQRVNGSLSEDRIGSEEPGTSEAGKK